MQFTDSRPLIRANLTSFASDGQAHCREPSSIVIVLREKTADYRHRSAINDPLGIIGESNP